MTSRKAGAKALAPALLRKWLDENRRSNPEWQVIAKRLIDDLDMAVVWEAVGHENALLVFGAAQKAYQYAEAERNRRRPKEELEALVQVKKAALALKEAIKASPLPREPYAKRMELPGEGGLAPLTIQVAWRTAPVGFGLHSLQLPDLMDTVADWVDSHVESLPPRFAHRRKEPWSAFARHLAFLLEAQAIPFTSAQLAIIINATLARYDDRFTADQVKAFLRGA